MKKPSKQWVAILVVLAGMAWGATAGPNAAPLHAPPFAHKNLIPGG